MSATTQSKTADCNTQVSQTDRVLLAAPRGFCAGVEMAIKALATMVRTFPAPVYCYHEIVHNEEVVRCFEAKGVIFVDSIDNVPPNAPIMLSAHGSAPKVVKAASDKGRFSVNSVCPLVTKVHHEVRVRSKKGYEIIYVGHEGHEEAIGTMAVAPNAIHRVEDVEDVEKLPDLEGPLALLAQTTLSHRDWKDVADAATERFPEMWMPGRSDLCFATTNRQQALLSFVSDCQSMIVIGSPNSSNTLALAKLATESGCEQVLRVNRVEEIKDKTFHGTVGVTAGASAPEELVEEIIEFLAPVDGVTEVSVIEEDEYFPPPPPIRQLLMAVASAASATLGGPTTNTIAEDRGVGASKVLSTLR